MALSYSNPYSSSSQAQASSGSFGSPPVQRSTFAALANRSTQGYHLFWSGLPADVTESSLQELLSSERISLNTSSIQCFYAADGSPLGMALTQVSNEADAERLRMEYSGRQIDRNSITLQHMLAPTQTFPSANIPAYPMQPPPPPAPAINPRAKTDRPGPGAKGKTVNGKAGLSSAAPGLSLLKRISTPGTNQNALLARQKANLKGKSLGDALSSRISGPKLPTSAVAKGKNARNVSASGSAKVSRAKASANKDAMDIDRPTPTGKKPVNGKSARPEPVTQAKLDEEMRLWERQRKFAA